VYQGQYNPDHFYNETALPSVAHGGAGNDDFRGGPGVRPLLRRGRDDDILGNERNDTIDGGAGFDEISGGGGTDIADWEDATGPVTVTLDGIANDGQSTEHENVPSDVEGVQGGPFGDTLVGNRRSQPAPLGGAGADDINGGNGDDLVNGQAGDDTLHFELGADQIYGGTDTDSLSYAGAGSRVTVIQDFLANDGTLARATTSTRLRSSPARRTTTSCRARTATDVIDGRNGSDRITPKGGSDTVLGGGQNDLISGGPGTSSDSDNVDGGDGVDTNRLLRAVRRADHLARRRHVARQRRVGPADGNRGRLRRRRPRCHHRLECRELSARRLRRGRDRRRLGQRLAERVTTAATSCSAAWATTRSPAARRGRHSARLQRVPTRSPAATGRTPSSIHAVA
jgi:Ca2+-binding RTX toxin-like protein